MTQRQWRFKTQYTCSGTLPLKATMSSWLRTVPFICIFIYCVFSGAISSSDCRLVRVEWQDDQRITKERERESRRKRSSSLSTYGIRPGGLRKTTTGPSQYRRSASRDLDPRLREYEAAMLITRQRRRCIVRIPCITCIYVYMLFCSAVNVLDHSRRAV